MNKKQTHCPNGHSNIHFASFYPNPTITGELTHPMICCLICKKFLYEIELDTEKTVIRLDTKPIY